MAGVGACTEAALVPRGWFEPATCETYGSFEFWATNRRRPAALLDRMNERAFRSAVIRKRTCRYPPKTDNARRRSPPARSAAPQFCANFGGRFAGNTHSISSQRAAMLRLFNTIDLVIELAEKSKVRAV